MFQIQNTYSQSRSNFLAQPQLSLCLLIKPQLPSNSSLPPYKLAMRALFFQQTFQRVFFLFCFLTYLQILLANACPCGSATSFFFVIVFIELCKHIMIEVAENIYYYFYLQNSLSTANLISPPNRTNYNYIHYQAFFHFVPFSPLSAL